MRKFSAALVAVALAACGHHHRDNACEHARDAHVVVLRVDDNSDYMKRVVEHVGMAPADSGAVDPDARKAGVRVLVDSWQTAENAAITDHALTGPSRAAIAHYVDTLGTPPADHTLAYERLSGAMWRSFYVETTPIVIGSSVVGGEPTKQGFELELDSRGAKALDRASADAVGHKLAIVVGDEVVSAPVVATAIHGGKFEITSHDTADDAALLKRLGCTR